MVNASTNMSDVPGTDQFAGGSLRFEAGGHLDSAPRHMSGHVLTSTVVWTAQG